MERRTAPTPPTMNQKPNPASAMQNIRPQKTATANGIVTIRKMIFHFGVLVRDTRGLFPCWEKQPDHRTGSQQRGRGS